MTPRGPLARRAAGRVLDHAADLLTTYDLPHCRLHNTPALASCSWAEVPRLTQPPVDCSVDGPPRPHGWS
jgi:hypothetical protein